MGPNVAEAAKLIEYGNSQVNYMGLMDDNRLVATQNVINILTDSAAAGTSISCGVRTLNGSVGEDQNYERCQNFVEYLKEKDNNIKTGIISKVYSVHATPGAFLLHSSERYNYKLLYDSLVVDAKADFIAGGYQQDFTEEYIEQMELNYNIINYTQIEENNNIIEETELPMLILTTPDENTPYLLDDNVTNQERYPNTTILNLTMEAIHKFDQQQFFIMTEASLVDWGGHANNITQNIGDMIEADYFVRKMIEYIDQHEDENINLLVIADHGCGGVGNVADPSLVLQQNDIPNSNETLDQQNQKRINRLERLKNYTFSTGDHENSDVWLSAYGKWFREENRLKGMYHHSQIRELLERIMNQE